GWSRGTGRASRAERRLRVPWDADRGSPPDPPADRRASTPSLPEPGEDPLVGDTLAGIAEPRPVWPDRSQIVIGPRLLAIGLVGGRRGGKRPSALGGIDVGVGERAQNLRRDGHVRQRALERGVRGVPGPRRQPTARAHGPRQPLAVVADDRVAAERKDRT